MSERDFNAFNSLSELREMLGKYSDEKFVSRYSQECYIQDILLFLGKSIDNDKFGGDARGYFRFVSREVFPISDKINESEKFRFKQRLMK